MSRSAYGRIKAVYNAIWPDRLAKTFSLSHVKGQMLQRGRKGQKKSRRTQVWATWRTSARYELETNEWPKAQAIACRRGHESAWKARAEGLMCVWEVHLANA